MHVVGKGNKLINNYLEQNKNTQIIVQGNKNNITGNRAYNGVKSGLYVYGSLNTLSKNTIHKNKAHGIVLKGSSNQLTGNFAQYNLNYGVYINGSKNKIIQNTIRGNTVGIVQKQGSSGSYNYNYIVNNKKYNLYRDKGSINANYNWWGENKVTKVKNEKISRWVVAKIISPKVNYLGLNKTYTITFILVDNKNKKLNKTIPSTKAKFWFLKRVGDKWKTSVYSPKNQTLVNNKATIKIETIGSYRIYNFKAVIDNQKLNKVFYPPCDLKVWIVPSPNPVLQGFVVTYIVYIENKGPGDAYNVTFSSKNLNIKYAQYSFDGKKWKNWKGSLKISKISKNKIQRVYISGILPSNLKGKIQIDSAVKSVIYDLNSKNNKYSFVLKIIKLSSKLRSSKKYPSYCGPSTLQQLLSSKGIHVSKNTLIKELNSKNGQTSMYMMIKVAKKHGLILYAEKVPLKNLKKDDIVLLNISGNTHYVTIISIGKNTVTINDPSIGPMTIHKSDFNRWYTGYALSTQKKGTQLSTEKQKDIKGGVLPLILFFGLALVVSFSAVGVVHARSVSYRPSMPSGSRLGGYPARLPSQNSLSLLRVTDPRLYNSYVNFNNVKWSGFYDTGLRNLINKEPNVKIISKLSGTNNILHGGDYINPTWSGYNPSGDKSYISSKSGSVYVVSYKDYGRGNQTMYTGGTVIRN